MSFWRKEFEKDREFILLKIKENRSLTPDGRVSFTGIHYDHWFSVLISAIGVEFKSDTLREQTVRWAIRSPELGEDFTEPEFRGVVWRLRERFLKNIKTYRVVFPIWNSPSFLSGPKKIGDVTLNFSPSKNTRIFKAIIRERTILWATEGFKKFFTQRRIDDLSRCSICFAHVRASSPKDANEQASKALHEILGLINLVADTGKFGRKSVRPQGKLPVSEVLIGPYTTVHFANGKLAKGGFWHENWVGGPEPLTRSDNDAQAWAKNTQFLIKRISRSPWRESCKSAAARYFKAFSNPNLEESFLEGWGLFENISGSQKHKIPDQILRASNVFGDNYDYFIIGKHLQLRRNFLAHGHGLRADDEEALAFQMLNFVSHFLKLYIINGFDFEALEDFWEFLDLPAERKNRDIKQLEHQRQLDLLAKAAKFRRET